MKLNQQTFAQIPRGHTQRIEFLYDGQRFFDVVHLVAAVQGQLVERRRQVSIFIQISDDGFRDFARLFRANNSVKLPLQMFGKSRWRRKEFFKGRAFNCFAFTIGAVIAAGI